ncbi:MAG: DUF7697 family protein [Inquilinus sp.]|uniref:DUF7697 family protein n=1 Tax=Inquilinus sp. TaxID=1932117 RepID=UPI003F2A6099
MQRCPYIEFAPRTVEGAEAWDVLKRSQGQMRCAGMAGAVVGLDMPAALRLGEDLGYDRLSLAQLLPTAEPAAIEAINRQVQSRTEKIGGP